MKTLLVGFKKYAGHDSNPSEKVIESLQGGDIVGCVLDVSFAKARKLPEIIEREKPDFIITMNLSPFKKEPTIEEYAYNEIRSEQPDEEGILIKDSTPVDPEGPKSLNSVLDIPSIQQFLSSRGCSISMSIDPGLWICNMVSYLARESKIPSVSLHLPQAKDFPIAEQVEVVENIIEYFSLI